MRLTYLLLMLAVSAATSACEPGETGGIVAASASAASGETKSAGADIDAVVTECAECHSGRLGFSGESPENLAKAIAALAAGDKHEGIPELSPEDLARLAAALTKL